MILQGKRIRLRPFAEQEIEVVKGWLATREPLIGDWQPYQPEMATQVGEMLQAHLEPDDKGGWLAIELTEIQQVIGQVRYSMRRLVPGLVEYYDLGYSIADLEWRGKGLAHEACSLLIEYLFAAYPIERIGAFIYSGNQPSIQLLSRLGFTCEGVIRRATYFDADWHDIEIYGLLRGEWTLGISGT